MKPNGLSLRVLVYQEKGQWTAHALELDVLGCGATVNKALTDLAHATLTQLAFAHFKNDASLLDFPADKQYFDRWDKAQRHSLAGIAGKDSSITMEAVLDVAQTISFTPEEIQSSRERKFEPALAYA